MADTAHGRYAFAVSKEATKRDIAQAVGTVFGVKVVSVKTMIVKGKARRFGRFRSQTRLPDWKKAVVALAKGEKIEVFELEKKEKKDRRI